MPASRGTQAANEETYAREEEQGIRHNWLMGSMASSVMILTACMLLLICSVTAFFYLSLRRIPFAHIRNIKHHSPQDFDEAAHLSSCGDLDMFEIVRAFYESGFDGYIRPDHGRMIWGEQARPGYGLYDRALGATYLQGLWEAIDKIEKRGN